LFADGVAGASGSAGSTVRPIVPDRASAGFDWRTYGARLRVAPSGSAVSAGGRAGIVPGLVASGAAIGGGPLRVESLPGVVAAPGPVASRPGTGDRDGLTVAVPGAGALPGLVAFCAGVGDAPGVAGLMPGAGVVPGEVAVAFGVGAVPGLTPFGAGVCATAAAWKAMPATSEQRIRVV
jgi:hypothetical protein